MASGAGGTSRAALYCSTLTPALTGGRKLWFALEVARSSCAWGLNRQCTCRRPPRLARAVMAE
jgi:hypothetical protein